MLFGLPAAVVGGIPGTFAGIGLEQQLKSRDVDTVVPQFVHKKTISYCVKVQAARFTGKVRSCGDTLGAPTQLPFGAGSHASVEWLACRLVRLGISVSRSDVTNSPHQSSERKHEAFHSD
jgi:hypothetical protein